MRDILNRDASVEHTARVFEAAELWLTHQLDFPWREYNRERFCRFGGNDERNDSECRYAWLVDSWWGFLKCPARLGCRREGVEVPNWLVVRKRVSNVQLLRERRPIMPCTQLPL